MLKKRVTFNKLVLDNLGGFNLLKQPPKRLPFNNFFNKHFNRNHHQLLKYI
jgi:hypothetical protein